MYRIAKIKVGVSNQYQIEEQRQKIENMLKELRSTAKVEVLIPLTEDKPKSEEPATIESVEPTAPAESAPAAENAAPADVAK